MTSLGKLMRMRLKNESTRKRKDKSTYAKVLRIQILFAILPIKCAVEPKINNIS